MASLSKIIDVHSHPVLAFGEGAPVGEGHKQPAWSVESALSYMEEHDISACVLSAPASANRATGQETRDIARRTNEVLAEIVSKHPNRFGAVATLPGLDADGALAEIGYALDTLKMDGVATTTSLDDAYLGEPQFDAWFEELNRRGATLFVHPTITKAGATLLNGLGRRAMTLSKADQVHENRQHRGSSSQIECEDSENRLRLTQRRRGQRNNASAKQGGL